MFKDNAFIGCFGKMLDFLSRTILKKTMKLCLKSFIRLDMASYQHMMETCGSGSFLNPSQPPPIKYKHDPQEISKLVNLILSGVVEMCANGEKVEIKGDGHLIRVNEGISLAVGARVIIGINPFCFVSCWLALPRFRFRFILQFFQWIHSKNVKSGPLSTHDRCWKYKAPQRSSV